MRSFLSLDDGAFSNECSVQELTLVLGADEAGLGKLGAAKGNGLLVDTFKDKLILNFSAGADLASGLHNNLLDVSTTEEVLHFNVGSVLGNNSVNGEMSIDQSHLVKASLGDASHNVSEESVNSLDLTLELVGTEPHADANCLHHLVVHLFVHKAHLDLEMGHVLNNFTTGSFDSANSILDCAGHYIEFKLKTQGISLPPAGIISHSSVKVCLILLYLLY